MIQDIYPSRLDCSYKAYEAKDEDTALFFDTEGRMLIGEDKDSVTLTTVKDASGKELQYLFSLDDRKVFLVKDNDIFEKEGFQYLTVREIRDSYSGMEIFAVFTAYHLWKWYADNRFCGKCGKGLIQDERERAMRCPDCGNTVYPRINPAVIVGVTKGDSILLTKYRRGYSHNALVAGFTEIGETLEETVQREVMEETGLHVKNIRYYKSQPWGMVDDLLAGFYCDVDGEPAIHLDPSELKLAKWVTREEIELQPDDYSLTNEMMKRFKENSL